MLREGLVDCSFALAAHGLSDDSKSCWRKCCVESCSWKSSSSRYRRPTIRAADLVVRAAKKPPSQRGAFSVSTVGSPTKPLTQTVGRQLRTYSR